MPPSCAMAIAMSLSVTVSIAAEISGMLSRDLARQPACWYRSRSAAPGNRPAPQHIVEGQRLGDDVSGRIGVIECHAR